MRLKFQLLCSCPVSIALRPTVLIIITCKPFSTLVVGIRSRQPCLSLFYRIRRTAITSLFLDIVAGERGLIPQTSRLPRRTVAGLGISVTPSLGDTKTCREEFNTDCGRPAEGDAIGVRVARGTSIVCGALYGRGDLLPVVPCRWVTVAYDSLWRCKYTMVLEIKRG
jgi:hypothetical protein